MGSKDSNHGLPYIFEGTTESEAQLHKRARDVVAKRLGIHPADFEQQLEQKPIDQNIPVYVRFPPTKYTSADFVVKDKLKHTPAQKKEMANKWITRKKTYPYDTPKGIDFVTRTLKEESTHKLNPRENKDIDILNKEMKLSALKGEIESIPKFEHHNPDSYPSSPEQRRRLKNIADLEKSLGYNKEELHPAEKHYEDELNKIQKKGKSWMVKHLKKADAAQSRTHAQLTKLKEFGKNPLVAEEKGSDFYFDPSTNQLELKSKPPELRPKLQAARKTPDATTGAKYIPREQRVYESLKIKGYESPEKSDRSFAKLEAQRSLEDERSKRRNARFI